MLRAVEGGSAQGFLILQVGMLDVSLASPDSTRHSPSLSYLLPNYSVIPQASWVGHFSLGQSFKSQICTGSRARRYQISRHGNDSCLQWSPKLTVHLWPLRLDMRSTIYCMRLISKLSGSSGKRSSLKFSKDLVITNPTAAWPYLKHHHP